jgi:hypothetical protein
MLVSVAILGRGRSWVRFEGRANAGLLLLARAMDAEFVAPPHEAAFAEVRGRTKGCTFELVVDARSALSLTVRHFHSQCTVPVAGPGCDVPDLDPDAVRAAIEDACLRFATDH